MCVGEGALALGGLVVGAGRAARAAKHALEGREARKWHRVATLDAAPADKGWWGSCGCHNLGR